MIHVAMITRATLFTTKGGDTVQITQTARYLEQFGVKADIFLTTQSIDYQKYTLLHFFNITRPADMLTHIQKSKLPFVISPIWVDYSGYDQQHRKGPEQWLFRHFSQYGIEYMKTIARWLTGRDVLASHSFIWRGQWRSMQYVWKKASMVLPNSASEYNLLTALLGSCTFSAIIPNGIDPVLFKRQPIGNKDEQLVLCVARIEGIKNQHTLIEALNDSPFRLVLIGDASPNQQNYYRHCKKKASVNIEFIPHLSQQELLYYYQTAKVHILPSWFESCGLSSLEAAAMGCNIIVTDKGFTRDYFAELADYCNPSSAASIRQAIEGASLRKNEGELQHKIYRDYTWKEASYRTSLAYQKILQK